MAAQYMTAPPGMGMASGPPPETWMEAKTADGKSYYYHSVTRQTAWSLPPGAVLLRPPQLQQPEVASSTSQQLGAGGISAAHNAVAQAQAASQYQLGAASLNPGQVPSLSVSQQPPFAAAGLPPSLATASGVASMPFPPPGMMGTAVPPPGIFAMPPGMGFFPFGQFMPLAMMTPVQRGDPADWTEYTTEDGRSYWYNSKLSRTTWDKPLELAEHEQKKLAEAAVIQQKNSEVKPAAEAKKEASTKPIARQIPGTPWCVVWTSDKRSFFHNPSTKASVWKRPAELIGMKEVDEIAAQNPDDIAASDGADPKSSCTNGTSDSIAGKRDASALQEDGSAKRYRSENVDETSRDSFSDAGSEAGKPVRSAAFPRPALQKDKPRDPAYEAALKAVKDRERIPLEDRVKTFKELLAEKDVSAFSTWEKELPKIVFDPRYLLLTSKERRDVFDEFTRDKTEKEREEKKRKMEELREAFRQLLRDANLNSKISYGEFASKFKSDERLRAIERNKDREQLFEEYMGEIRRKEKEARQVEREKIRSNFFELLEEMPGVNRKSHWADVKKKVRDDPRYERVDSSNQREEWFRDFIKTLVKRKDKESDEETKPEEGEENEEDKRAKLDREKQERIDASLREREREVQEELSSISKDREKEREHHRQEEAVQHYRALLTDLIRQTDLTYKEARKILKKDARYELAEPLHKHQKEDLYEEHLDMLSAKKKQMYRELLEEADVQLDSSWKEVRRKIREDARYAKFSSSDTKCEKEFQKFLRDKTNRAKEEFRELLKETKLLDYKTKTRLEESEQNIKDLIEILKNDKRYLILDPLSSDRKEILADYIDELARRGPPPPPTASEPSRRGK